ncbi:MAG: putative intracellular protease/amidase [Bermanella sp.]|jgi:putative intracellular protease/amidase|uniref:type 1 glutamine amidotransferase domain-containing protein n=1 Tax=Glaciecola sp. 33A TaxID=2057807 RepID=UPI000C31D346|nr:type 1 glutamine amidotransferase domain-containing protein [Glaciecola sp. 33A]PKI00712.1 type 1 glutamine amidotransferase domain-containing protein [Glaciecola sp. 33A]
MTDLAKKTILMVITSHDKLGNTGEKTGFWVEELAAPYYVLKNAGFNIVLASPLGGQPPIDPKSELADFQTDETRKFDKDVKAQAKLANTLKLSDIEFDQIDAIFYPGGHGPLWDLVDNIDSISLIENSIKHNKPVAAVCHASAVFLHVRDPQGESIVNGKTITGFSNTEEDAVELSLVVPFLLEDELKAKGGVYQKGDDWGSFAVEDGLIITGQNPASSAAVAKRLVCKLKA